MVPLTEAVPEQWGVGTQLMSKIPAETSRRERPQRKREMGEGTGRREGEEERRR